MRGCKGSLVWREMECKDRHWPSMSILQLVQFVVDSPPNFLSTELIEAQFQTMVAVIWEQIWNIKNKIIFQKAKVKIDMLLAIIEKKFQEHMAVLEQQHSNKSSRQINLWQAPHSNVFKINCDVAHFDNACCIAMVIRDRKGNVIAAGTRMETKASISAAEAKGLRCALVTTKLLKLRRVEVEGDSKICIDAMNKVSLKNHDYI